MNKKFLLVGLCFLAIAFTIYFPGIHASRYGDDFTVVPMGELKYDLEKIWTSTYQRYGFYRPVEDTITTAFIMIFGWNTTPTHILFILIHSIFAAFLYKVMIKLKYTHFTSLCGALFMLIAQVNVTSVGGNDTLGMLLSSSLGFLSLWLIYRSIATPDSELKGGSHLYFISMFLIVIVLFTKESGMAFYPLFFVLLLLYNSFFLNPDSVNLKKTILVALPFLIIFIVFYLIRSSIVPAKPSFGEDTYNFHFGLNIPKNISMLLFAIFLPVSSVKMFEAIQTNNYWFITPVILITALFVLLIIYGVLCLKKNREALVLLMFIIAGFFPFAILNHVNEQYTYFSIPFAGMLIGIGSGYYIEYLKGLRRMVMIIFLGIIFLLNAGSVMEKTKRINTCGERSDKIFSQLVYYFPLIEHNRQLILVNNPGHEKNYSAFKIPDFEIMRYAQFMIFKLAGRDDFTVEVIEWDEQYKFKQPGNLMLRLDKDDNIIKMN